jgi:hypothetical protein
MFKTSQNKDPLTQHWGQLIPEKEELYTSYSQPFESNIDYWILKCSQRLLAKYIQNVKQKPISF